MNITLGQYLPMDSPLHRMDARVKIVLILIFSVLLFVFGGTFSAFVFGCFLFLLAQISHIPFKTLASSLKPLWWLIIFTMLFHFFCTPGEVLYALGPLELTVEGIFRGTLLSLRLVYLLIFSALLTFSTSPIMLTDALSKLLAPFKRFGIPAHELAMMMTIALRFLPTLMEEMERIMKAQKARGVDFSRGKLTERFKKLTPILVPLFISAFRRADELALAMDGRCYSGGEGRTHYRELNLTRLDYIAINFSIVVFLILLGGNFL